jgi:transposase InsO family protein
MGISTSSYYFDPKVSPLEKEESEADIRGKIEQIRVELPRAGYRELLAVMKKSGISIGERRLRGVLKKFELQIRPRKRFIATTDSNHSHLVHPNLIEGMTIDGINQVWAADITYIRILNGFVYLAVILDLYSRKVIGWQISKRIDGKLTLDALKMAIARRKPPKGVIHHSDRGVQYLSNDYVDCLEQNRFHASCSRKGNPYDNAFVESFMKTLKDNEVYCWEYETIIDVIERVPRFIEDVYNRKRPHSSLEYLSPEEFEEKWNAECQQNVSRPMLEI